MSMQNFIFDFLNISPILAMGDGTFTIAQYSEYYSSLYFVAIYFLTSCLMISFHYLRAQISLAPVLGLAGVLTFLTWQLTQIGWWVDWMDYKINASLLGVIPALLIGSILTYALDGVRAARAYHLVILFGAMLGMGYSFFIETLGRFSPMPSFFFTPFLGQLALAASVVVSGYIAVLSYESMRHLSRILAMPFGFAIGFASFLPLISFLTYGYTQGLVSISMDADEYLLVSIPVMVTLFAYGAIALKRNLFLPARAVTSIFVSNGNAGLRSQSGHQSIIEAREQISELRQLNQALQQEEALRYHQMMRSPMAMVELDKSGRLKKFNPAAQQLLAQSSAMGQKFFVEGTLISEFLPDIKPLLQNSKLQQNQIVKQIFELHHPDMGKQMVEITILPLLVDRAINGYSLYAEDVSAREQAAQKQLLSERVRGIHKTSQVLHHDFSNLLLAIQGNLSIVQNKATQDAELKNAIEAIQNASQRGREMLSQLGAGQVFDKPELKPQNLKSLISEATRIITPQANNNKVVITSAIDEAITVDIDSTQMLRVVINLMSNAIRAMQNGGKIDISTVMDNDGVSIRFADSGIGMTPEQLNQAFDPGFSTKGQGQGGLGLAISYLITEAHGGRLSLESLKGKGTTAKIWLPVIQNKLANVRTDIVTNIYSDIKTEYSGEAVLLYVPDVNLRNSLAESLVAMGYEIAELQNQQELSALLQEDSDHWTAIIRQKDQDLSPQLWYQCRHLCDVVIDPSLREPPRIRASSRSRLGAGDFEQLLRAA